jgi:hypothetical protein
MQKEYPMQTLTTAAAMHLAASQHPSVSLRQLLESRIEQLSDYDTDIASLARIVIYNAKDNPSDLTAVLGFNIQTQLWEFNDDYGDWCEITYVLSDDGYGCILYIEKAHDQPAIIQHLCAQATPPYMESPI